MARANPSVFPTGQRTSGECIKEQHIGRTRTHDVQDDIVAGAFPRHCLGKGDNSSNSFTRRPDTPASEDMLTTRPKLRSTMLDNNVVEIGGP